ncbi:carboxypeptidase regulatory-like domain-containing protein [Lyngbya aestuarii]|uniref:carboxypeptidase regulatory-like domain-containing protein n=1 Tax=Lyngbya aestuarii TaxID=118322 RepID=UPI00403E0465
MLYLALLTISPELVNPPIYDKAAPVTATSLIIANTPAQKQANSAIFPTKPTQTESFSAESLVSNPPQLPELVGESNAAQLAPPITVTIPDDWQEQLDLFEINTPVNLTVSNLDLKIYPTEINDSINQIELPSSAVTSSTTLVPHDADDSQQAISLPTNNSETANTTESLSPEESEVVTFPTTQSPLAQVPEGFTTFIVGIKLNRRNVITSVLVRGQENGTQALNFEQWLIPYDAVIQALKLNTKVLPDNQIELRSPSLALRINPNQLQTDPEIGLVFSVEQLRTLFGVEVEFDIIDYAIALEAPLQNQGNQRTTREIIVQTEGLPKFAPSSLTIGALEQRIDASGREGTSTNYRGDLSAVGSIFGGSWFVRANQPELFSRQTWRIAEAQFQRQTDATDYIVGSQSPFWRSRTGGDYWGLTTVIRNGFVPQLQLYGSADPRQRLQAAQMSRTISGKAEPGTLVQLVQGFSNNTLAEVLVDSTGVYRFEDVEFEQGALGNYRVLLYPQGRLTEQPEIRTATFSNLPGQIPAGSSAYVLSGGWRRHSGLENQGLLGNFSDFQGGAQGRWGVSNSLTVGLGAVYDQSLKGLGEIFFQPQGFPLKVTVAALTGTEDSDWDINADLSFEPSRNFTARLTSDRFSTRLNTTWRVFPGLSFIGSTNSKDAISAGIQLAFSGKNYFTFASATLDSKSRFRWNLLQRLNQFELRSIGNEVTTQSALTYHFTANNSSSGNSLVLSYDTRNQNNPDNLLSLSWRYRSRTKLSNGNPLWDTQLGYGIGSQGSGIIASVATAIIPGLRLQAQYQGVSASSNESAFSLNLVSNLTLQQGITPSEVQTNYLRTQGGLLVQPFFDRNQNGRRDAGEKFYTDPELVLLNNGSLKDMRPEIQDDQIMIHLPPGTYRLDLDPAGFPLDWQATVNAYAVDVVAGSYTPISIPLIKSYSRSGVVTDEQGNPVSGARVEAIEAISGQRLFSVTNDAGVFYLEGLQQGIYTFEINSQQAVPESLELKEVSEPFDELNLQQVPCNNHLEEVSGQSSSLLRLQQF